MPLSRPDTCLRFLFLPKAWPRAAIGLLLTVAAAAAAEPEDPRVAWGRERLQRALQAAGYAGDGVTISTTVDPASPLLPDAARRAEGYAVEMAPRHLRITGHDPAGVLYGCLDAAAAIAEHGEIVAGTQLAEAPTLELRGPGVLLMKLGSYNFAVSPEEFPFFYDRAEWRRWLDRMAELRFNCLTLWNGHPFAYFVHLPQYPEAQDGMPPGLLERNRAQLHWLVAEAGRRNIRLVFEFYNIHTSVYFQRAHDLPDEVRTPTPLLRDYTAHAVETFVREFPDIGYHITPGEALDLAHTDTWVNDVLLPAMERGGRRGPVWLRAWGMDLPHAERVAALHPEVWMERKFNVEMIADTRADPENRAWADLTGRHIVNIHMAANLEPLRWSPPDYIRKCVESAIATGATGLHLYPRKAWRWPRGSEPDLPLVQWERDWSWYVAWARYTWNPQRDPGEDRTWWRQQLTRRFGDPDAAELFLQAGDANADVLPALQRLIWLGNDNHTVVAAGIRLSQLERAGGIPFLDLPGVAQRIPAFLESLRQGHEPPAPTPLDFLAQQVADATRAVELITRAGKYAKRHQAELAAWARDHAAVLLVARFYREKLSAAGLRAQATTPGSDVMAGAFLEPLDRSLAIFRSLATLLEGYDSLSDVPAWNPARLEKTPYHWRDLVPLFEREADLYRRTVENTAHPPSTEPTRPGLVGMLFGDTGWRRPNDSLPTPTVDFHWPYDLDRGRHWSAEWRGFLLPLREGPSTLRIQSDQPVWLEVDDKLVIDGQPSSGRQEMTTTVPGGRALSIRLRYDHPEGDDSFLRIEWDATGSGFVVVPESAWRHSEREAAWVESEVMWNDL